MGTRLSGDLVERKETRLRGIEYSDERNRGDLVERRPS